MSKNNKQLSNPFSTGGGGHHFEAHVQASFVVLMLTGGYAPCMPCWSINEIKLQGKIDGFDTDDLIIFVQKPGTEQKRKILGQVKHAINITKNNKVFSDVVQAAWNDFNNPEIFTRGEDIIVLFSGSLSATDTENVQWLLDHARHTKNEDEFFRNVQTANFSSTDKRNKLEAFRTQLKKANNSMEPSNAEIYLFLRSFHLLGYDLGTEMGVVLSLLHSHISQFNIELPPWAWARIVDIVQTWNQNAGTIVRENLPEDLLDAFKPRNYSVIPPEMSIRQPQIQQSWSQNTKNAQALTITNFIGAWNEEKIADLAIIRQFLKEEYDNWITKIREVLQYANSPIYLKNKQWKVTNRKQLWDELSARIYDNDLDIFQNCAVSVLTERDPKFDLPVNERYTAGIYNKILTHSFELRKGMVETLALLGCRGEVLVHCSRDKAENTSILVIRKIFEQADSQLWGSLNNLLPILAEAAPKEFLDTVENALKQNPCPFDELFLQEGGGFAGENYLTGLFWALEILAWDETLLVRVCCIFGELATHDPGGKWSNRPENSLITILLPWLPQTLADVDVRKAALLALQAENPDVTWKVLLKLLSNQHQMSFGTQKPLWRNTIPDDFKKDVTQEEYWNQIACYFSLALSMANNDVLKLTEIINCLGNVPITSFNEILDHLLSQSICNKTEDERLPLWIELTKFALKHKRFSNAAWSLNIDSISKIDEVILKLAPKNPLNLYQRLFNGFDVDLYDENGDWDTQRQKLDVLRQKAVQEVLNHGGIDAVIQFAKLVDHPEVVSLYFCDITTDKIANEVIFPSFLDNENIKLSQFSGGYINRKLLGNTNWQWVDSLDKSKWSRSQIVKFLSFLPFVEKTWTRVSEWLGNFENEYWEIINANPYATDSDLNIAIDKFIQYGRPKAAIECLGKMLYSQNELNTTQVVKVLLSAINSKECATSTFDIYNIVKLIKLLQDEPHISADDLFRVEWAYLPLLDKHNGGTPKFLENKLASDSQFFCEIIRLIYRSTNDNESNKKLTPRKKIIAENGYDLLCKWRISPGIQIDGSFCEKQFLTWLEQVKEECVKSGHLDVALVHIGQVIFYSPSDSTGLWINKVVAEALNATDAEKMRNGFRTAAFNSRGCHVVDPTGTPELELSDQYKQKAKDVEQLGYRRFATTLRELAKTYDYDASCIIDDYKSKQE